jgi:hypothetical protein
VDAQGESGGREGAEGSAPTYPPWTRHGLRGGRATARDPRRDFAVRSLRNRKKKVLTRRAPRAATRRVYVGATATGHMGPPVGAPASRAEGLLGRKQGWSAHVVFCFFFFFSFFPFLFFPKLNLNLNPKFKLCAEFVLKLYCEFKKCQFEKYKVYLCFIYSLFQISKF